MNFPGPTAYSVPGFGTGENTRGDSPLTYVAVYAATSTSSHCTIVTAP